MRRFPFGSCITMAIGDVAAMAVSCALAKKSALGLWMKAF